MKAHEELKELMSKDRKQSYYANRLNMGKTMITEILKGNRRISVLMAVKLEAIGEKTATYWLHKQLDEDIEAIKKKGYTILEYKTIQEQNQPT